MIPHKSRDISILNYLECLIDEYYLAELRSKVYRRGSDRAYWQKTMTFKKEKIEDISNRNVLPSIFTSSELYYTRLKRYYPANDIPLLIKNAKDLRSYYSCGCDVSVTTSSGTTVTGTIEDVDLELGFAWVSLTDNSDTKQYKLHQVRRIL